MPAANTKHDVFRYIDMTAGRDACWRWKGPVGGRSRDPRPYFSADGQRWIAYRLVYELVHGVTLSSTQLICHSCDNGSMPVGCCNPQHLRVDDNQGNMRDMTARQRHGMPHHVVKAIRRLIDEGRTHQSIADLYGVSRETVTAINRGAVYAHLPDEDTVDASATENER